MANLATLEEIEEIAQELEDRFGPLPEPVRNLLYLLRVRTHATSAGASTVSRDGSRVIIRFESSEDLTPVKAAVIQHLGNIAQVRSNQVALPWGRGGDLSQGTLLQLLETMAEARQRQLA